VADVSEPMSDLWTEAEEELSPVAPPYAVDVLKSMEDIQMDDADLNIRPMPLYPSYPLGRKGITSYPLTYTLDGIDLDLDLTESAEVEGTVVGAIALITGSTVGAGVLALPATVAPAGFLPSTAVLTGCWAFLLVQALLLAEVCVAVMRERDEVRRRGASGRVESARGRIRVSPSPRPLSRPPAAARARARAHHHHGVHPRDGDAHPGGRGA